MDPQEPQSKSDVKKMRVNAAINRARRKFVILFGSVVVGIILVIWLVIWLARISNIKPPGDIFANQGQEHVGLEYQYTYNSNPPTSGPHFASPAMWKVYDYEVNDKMLIHNLEHGGIWIAYRPGISKKAIDDLKNIVTEFGGSQILMEPRAANDTDVAVVAWMHLYTFNLNNEKDGLANQQKQDIRNFYKALKNHGPEFVPAMEGIDPQTIPGGVVK